MNDEDKKEMEKIDKEIKDRKKRLKNDIEFFFRMSFLIICTIMFFHIIILFVWGWDAFLDNLISLLKMPFIWCLIALAGILWAIEWKNIKKLEKLNKKETYEN